MSVLRFDCRYSYPAGFKLDFAFDAEQKITALIGPSGSGKTTALNLIAGLLTPNDGTIQLGERKLYCSRTHVDSPPESREIGYVFQDFQLFPHLTVAENLRYGQQRCRTHNVAFDKVISTLGLDDIQSRWPESLSGGQKQRVALGRALLRAPALLLLDEPFNAIDPALRDSVTGYLRRVVAEFGIPTILVSHNPADVAALEAAVISMPV